MDNLDLYNDVLLVNPDITGLDDAIFYAMTQVQTCDNNPLRWFGPIDIDGTIGTFYADTERFAWFPDTKPMEAIGSLTAEFGEDFTDDLI